VRKKNIIEEIKAENSEILPYIVRKFFPVGRKFLVQKGVRDSLTPGIFTNALTKILLRIKKNNFPSEVDFNSILQSALLQESKEINNHYSEIEDFNHKDLIQDVVANCVEILDSQSQKLLFHRFAEGLTYEEIALKVGYGNSVIAQFETAKVFKQLQTIANARLNIEQN
jgi:hypothetical protein